MIFLFSCLSFSQAGFYCISQGDGSACDQSYRENIVKFDKIESTQFSPDSSNSIHFYVDNATQDSYPIFPLSKLGYNLEFTGQKGFHFGISENMKEGTKITANSAEISFEDSLQFTTGQIVAENTTFITSSVDLINILPESTSNRFNFVSNSITAVIGETDLKINNYNVDFKKFAAAGFTVTEKAVLSYTGTKNFAFKNTLPFIIVNNNSELYFDETWAYMDLSIEKNYQKPVFITSGCTIKSEYVTYPHQLWDTRGSTSVIVDGIVGVYCLAQNDNDFSNCPVTARHIIYEQEKTVNRRFVPEQATMQNRIYIIGSTKDVYPIIPASSLAEQKVTFVGVGTDNQYIEYDASKAEPESLNLDNTVLYFTHANPTFEFKSLVLKHNSILSFSTSGKFTLNADEIISVGNSVINIPEETSITITTRYLEVCAAELIKLFNFATAKYYHIHITSSDKLNSLTFKSKSIYMYDSTYSIDTKIELLHEKFEFLTVDFELTPLIINAEEKLSAVPKGVRIIVNDEEQAVIEFTNTWSDFKNTENKVKILSESLLKVVTNIEPDFPPCFVLPNSTHFVHTKDNLICLFTDKAEGSQCPESFTKIQITDKTEKYYVKNKQPVNFFAIGNNQLKLNAEIPAGLNWTVSKGSVMITSEKPLNIDVLTLSKSSSLEISASYTKGKALIAEKFAQLKAYPADFEKQTVYFSAISCLQYNKTKSSVTAIMDQIGPKGVNSGSKGTYLIPRDTDEPKLLSSDTYDSIKIMINRRATETQPFRIGLVGHSTAILPTVEVFGEGTKFILFSAQFDSVFNRFGKNGLIVIPDGDSAVVMSEYERLPYNFRIQGNYEKRTSNVGLYCIYQSDLQSNNCPNFTTKMQVDLSTSPKITFNQSKANYVTEVFIMDSTQNAMPIFEGKSYRIHGKGNTTFVKLTGFMNIVETSNINVIGNELTVSDIYVKRGYLMMTDSFNNIGTLHADSYYFSKFQLPENAVQMLKLQVGTGNIKIGQNSISYEKYALTNYAQDVYFELTPGARVLVHFDDAADYNAIPSFRTLYRRRQLYPTSIIFDETWKKATKVYHPIEVKSDKGSTLLIGSFTTDFPDDKLVKLPETAQKKEIQAGHYCFALKENICTAGYTKIDFDPSKTIDSSLLKADSEGKLTLITVERNTQVKISKLTAKKVQISRIGNVNFESLNADNVVIYDTTVTGSVKAKEILLNSAQYNNGLKADKFIINGYINKVVVNDKSVKVGYDEIKAEVEIQARGKVVVSRSGTGDISIVPSIRSSQIVFDTTWFTNPVQSSKRGSLIPTQKSTITSQYWEIPSIFEYEASKFTVNTMNKNEICVYTSSSSSVCPSNMMPMDYMNTDKLRDDLIDNITVYFVGTSLDRVPIFSMKSIKRGTFKPLNDNIVETVKFDGAADSTIFLGNVAAVFKEGAKAKFICMKSANSVTGSVSVSTITSNLKNFEKYGKQFTDVSTINILEDGDHNVTLGSNVKLDGVLLPFHNVNFVMSGAVEVAGETELKSDVSISTNDKLHIRIQPSSYGVSSKKSVEIKNGTLIIPFSDSPSFFNVASSVKIVKGDIPFEKAAEVSGQVSGKKIKTERIIFICVICALVITVIALIIALSLKSRKPTYIKSELTQSLDSNLI